MKSDRLIPKAMTSRLKALTRLLIIIVLISTQPITGAQEVPPVLEFPQADLDDASTYRGYTTRFFKDSEGNTFQIVINQNTGRVVNLWADAANESLSFTARDTAGQSAILRWDSQGAEMSSVGTTRYVQYTLFSATPALDIGLFLLCSMRKERDFQYHQRHELPFSTEPYIDEELLELIRNLERFGENVRRRHLALLNAKNVQELRSRLVPQTTFQKSASNSIVRVEHPTFDGKNRLSLELTVDNNQAVTDLSKDKMSIRSLRRQPIQLTIKVGADSPSLTPLRREDIFNSHFFQFYERAKAECDSLLRITGAAEKHIVKDKRLLRFKRLHRQVKSVELLSFQQKLMAGLPNFATYFGRDMMMSALMMEPVGTPAMLENVMASVLRKLSPSGEVSHEEALGGQAIRENATEYNKLIAEYLQRKAQNDDAGANSVLARAEKLLGNLQAVTENYRMVDDDLQLPVLAARYFTRPDIPSDRKREFLQSASGKGDETSRLTLLMRNLLYVSNRARAYVENPVAENLVGFPKLDEHRWFPGSWRDSGAGYANGRFAMDVNAVWVPKALEAMHTIFSTLRELRFTPEEIEAMVPEILGAKLRDYLRAPESLRHAITIWRGARKHFKVNLNPPEGKQHVNAKLNWLPEPERLYWSNILAQSNAAKDGIEFLALSLDANGEPITVANSDPATLLFLENFTENILMGETTPEDVLKLLNVFLLPYPVGLFVEGLGPLAANDAYAPSEVWESYKRDHYHSPRVVWGREVNLVLLGLSNQILAAFDEQGRIKSPKLTAHVHELRTAVGKITEAVEASGLKHNELWGYRIEDGKLFPSRYATSSDIQLWNLTDLAVQYSLERIATQLRHAGTK